MEERMRRSQRWFDARSVNGYGGKSGKILRERSSEIYENFQASTPKAWLLRPVGQGLGMRRGNA
jgi:hypothetical protein